MAALAFCSPHAKIRKHRTYFDKIFQRASIKELISKGAAVNHQNESEVSVTMNICQIGANKDGNREYNKYKP